MEMMLKPIKQTTVLLFASSFRTKFIAATFLFTLVFGCAKESPSLSTPQSTRDSTRSPATFSNHLLFVHAGTNQYVALHETCLLEGTSSNKENITSYSWKKTSGPASYFIVTPDSLHTKITNLEVGEYEFELTATFSNGRKGKGAVTVFVIPPGQNEVIFNRVPWYCPMGCSATIKNFHSFVPRGKPYLVFVREYSLAAWQPVKHESLWSPTDKYIYGANDNSVWVYTDDLQGWIDIKITY